MRPVVQTPMFMARQGTRILLSGEGSKSASFKTVHAVGPSELGADIIKAVLDGGITLELHRLTEVLVG